MTRLKIKLDHHSDATDRIDVHTCNGRMEKHNRLSIRSSINIIPSLDTACLNCESLTVEIRLTHYSLMPPKGQRRRGTKAFMHR